MALLIVNADDYGLTEATSREILRCHREGIVTSTSVIALAPGFARTGALLSQHPDLGVGVHLALVGEDPPLLPASDIPSLVDDRGMLPRSWRDFVRRALVGRIDTDDVEREWNAQVDRVLDTGASLTHLDSHQHLHQWPSLWPVVRRVASRSGVTAIRTTARSTGGAMGALGLLARRRASRDGLRSTDRFLGFRQSGSLGEPELFTLLERIPDHGSVEIGCHPGAVEDDERARYDWGFQWSAESDALRSELVRRLVQQRAHHLSTFADLA